MSEPALQTPARLPRRSWHIAWLLGLGVLVNYFDRVNLSVSHESLIAAFGISNIAFGYLSGAYNWTYAFCQLPIGVLLDRFGVKRIGRVSTFIWSLASFCAAASPGIPSLFGARLLLGVGEAPTFPSNAKAIGLWFPPRARSFATSIFDAAAKFSSAIGVPLLGLILLRIGWRLSFALTGVISILFFLLFWKVYRDPAEDTSLTDAEREALVSGAHQAEWQQESQRRDKVSRLSARASQGHRPCHRLRLVQLRLLSTSHLAAELSIARAAHRPLQIVSIYRRALAGRNHRRPRRRRLARRCADSSRLRCQPRPPDRLDLRNRIRSWEFWEPPKRTMPRMLCFGSASPSAVYPRLRL